MIEFIKKLFGVKDPTPEEQIQRMKELGTYKSTGADNEHNGN